MLKTIKRLAIAILLGLAAQPGQAASESAIIDGFTEFLIDRANANLIAVFERRLKDDENFQCYFPNTYVKVEKLRLESLFGSRDYWENSLAVDLEILIYRAIFVEAQQGLKVLDRNAFLEAIAYFEYEYEDQDEVGEDWSGAHSLNFIDNRWPQPLKDQVNGFTNKLADALNRIDRQRIYDDVCEVPAGSKETLQGLLQPYMDAADDLSEWADHLEEYGKNLRLSDTGKREVFCKLNKIGEDRCDQAEVDDADLAALLVGRDNPDIYREAAGIARRLEDTFAALDNLDTLRKQQKDSIDQAVLMLPLLENRDFTPATIRSTQDALLDVKTLDEEKREQALVEILAAIKQKVSEQDPDAARVAGLLRELIEDSQSYTDQALIVLELLEDSGRFGSADMDRLRNSVMFFVSIADAEDKETVKGILELYTLPAVSYAEKRKPGDGFFVSSYLGYAAADADVHGSAEKETNGGLFVPVGIEYNYGLGGGDSLSVMLSPIDMAYPVNLKLRGIEDDVEFDELIAPSLTLAYGIEKYPLNVGIGYQRGRRLDDVDKTEERWLLFVTFDMPLFRLY
jgi:hypothetical protein